MATYNATATTEGTAVPDGCCRVKIINPSVPSGISPLMMVADFAGGEVPSGLLQIDDVVSVAVSGGPPRHYKLTGQVQLLNNGATRCPGELTAAP
jgi:hypothetical protein